MKQLISLKRILLVGSILSAGIFYQACQKDEKALPQDTELSADAKNSSAATSECAKNVFVTVNDTIQAANQNDAVGKLSQGLKEKGQAQCNGGDCIIGLKCKFFVVDGRRQVKSIGGNKWAIRGWVKGKCDCAD
jgi:hypothetical protein